VTEHTFATAESRRSTWTRSSRWVGVLAMVAAGMGIVGSLVKSFEFFGATELRVTWLDTLPWIIVLILGVCVHFLRGRGSTASAYGLVTFSAVIAGPTLLVSLAELRQVKFESLLTVGLLLSIVAAVLLIIGIWTVVAKAASIGVIDIPKSPFRVEVLAIILVFVLVALLVPESSFMGFTQIFGEYAQWAYLLSWVVPLALVLTFTLRSPGLGSVWVIAALAIAFVIEPLVRTVVLLIFSALDWVNELGKWLQPTGLAAGRESIPLFASAWLVIPVIVLCLVVLLWNANPSPVTAHVVERSPSAQIDPWAGTAFILSYVPLISFPAIVLGHISYERIVADGERHRGRVLAAAAIFFGVLNIALIALFVGGALDAVSNLLDRG
jgi:hypothetical protein